VAVGSDLTGRVATTVTTTGSQYDPANLIDDDLTTYDTTIETGASYGWTDSITVCFAEPQPDVTAMGVVFKFFADGGWLDEASHPIRIYASTDGFLFGQVSGLDTSTYSADHEDLAALSWDVESGYLFTFEPLTEPILCLGIQGDGGGTADPYPGIDTAGFLAVTEIEVFQIPEIFADGFEDGTTDAWSSP
jgi:hypothetical protein